MSRPVDRRRGARAHDGALRVSGLSGLLALLVLGATTLWTSCAEPETGESSKDVDVTIESVETPTPILPGSTLLVTARGVPVGSEGDAVLAVESPGGAEVTLAPIEGEDDTGPLAFAASDDFAAVLGTGVVAVDMRIELPEGASEPFATTLEIAEHIDVELDSGLSGPYFRNDEVVLDGAGLLGAGEGTVMAVFAGDFVPDSGGASVPVDAEMPVTLAEPLDRTRGVVRLSTALGGIEPGRLTGTIALRSSLTAGTTSTSSEQSVDIAFQPPALFNYGPTDPFLGQLVTIQGGGFLGALDDQSQDEATVLRFDGELTAEDGTTFPVSGREAVANFESGQVIELGIDVEPADDRLVSSFFGVTRGRFSGTVTPVVVKGTDQVEGAPVQAEIVLRGVQQVVHVRFLPGFFESLRHFGLSAGADAVVETAIERMRNIYADYNVRVETEVPDDVLPSAVATVEIGGPDPNGLGLFGYDNTPGKDIGNLRLFDSIGGENAETQADNYPGYGGVFIESFLFWSEHPELESLEGGLGPEPDPLFDEIFDPVRADAATLDEVRGMGERAETVARAIRALGSIIGETTAHELGHSLGLAQPYGSSTAFHSAIPGEGCLMDSGSARPFGERAGEPGYAETKFCEREPEYLEEVLPLP